VSIPDISPVISGMKRALVSVSDKTGLLEFVQGLSARQYEIVSTGGTAAALAAAGLPVVEVSAVTGFPELMDGRVKTLHPLIHGGILARRNVPADLDAAARQGIGLIDLVAVNLYPFVATAARPDVSFFDLIEQIDIGGPSLVRAAAKNFHDVLVVVEPSCYGRVLDELDQPGGPSPAFRFELARRAFAHTGAYDSAIASTLDEVETAGGRFHRPRQAAASKNAGPGVGPLPDRLTIRATKTRDLRYGENPHQSAAWYAIEPDESGAAVLQGKELSFTNLLDLDAAARLCLEFDEPAACVIKHTNPCGAAIGDTAATAYVRARDADPLAAFGGIVGLNRPIDEETARAIVATFVEAVIAPGMTDAARPVLSTKPNLRVVVADVAASGAPAAAARQREFRSVLGGLLWQEPDRVSEARPAWPSADLRVVTRRAPTDVEWRALRFAWRVMAHVKSNAVVFADAARTLAIGAGQMSRVDAVKVAVAKASGWRAGGAPALAGSVAASDAFFPFRDGLDECAAAGATAVVQPGGSVKDPEVIAAADEHGLAMVFTGRRHFRH
jgi:phosphoribosylaminoimidazolecarboxamide formyltransferase/IMP cyclohydrolase